MTQKLTCIALRTVKYDDRRSILTAWSREAGRLSANVAEGAGREARRRRALTMPMCVFECEADLRPGREIVSIRDIRPLRLLPSLTADPAKMVVAMFAAEVLDKILRTAQPEPELADFLFDAAARLDSAGPTGTANFPLTFMAYLAYMLGIGPDVADYRPGMVFDMADAVFRLSPPLGHRYISSADAGAVATLAGLSWDKAERLRMPSATRRAMLDGIIEYFTMHYAPLSGLRSLAVARDVFNS